MQGPGNNERYEGKFNVNSFKGARQLSVIGMGNNTNAEGFSFMDILNFTGELGRMQRGGGSNININVSVMMQRQWVKWRWPQQRYQYCMGRRIEL
jgi:hypothetical protein